MACSVAQGACRQTTETTHLKISTSAEKVLGQIKYGREETMAALRATSIPETRGCWSGAAGDFDGQLVSVGLAQWNFGKGSLQPLLKAYEAAFKTPDEFKTTVEGLMPTTWHLVFSSGCLRHPVTSECAQRLRELQSGRGNLSPTLKAELDMLFESDAMTQIQTDAFVSLLSSVVSDLRRVFPAMPITPTRIKWAIDTKVQQGGFPGDADIQRIRDRWRSVSVENRRAFIASVIRWYDGLCRSVDQDGVRLDCDYNYAQWTKLNDRGRISDEAADLFLLSHLKSRTAATKSGLYQANAFQRRASIALGTGSISGAQR
jgi:hypothetical protein